MYEALVAGKIGGYATDVMENEVAGDGLTEGAGFDSPLFTCDNFIVSPHIGAQTVDASRDIGAHIIGKVKEAHLIDTNKCIKCGTCIDKCKFGAISRG